VRVAPDQWKRHVELLHELGGHQAEKIGAGRLPDARSEGERVLGAARSANHRRRLQDPNPEACPRQHHRGDQTIVASADDQDVYLRHDLS
jgi:hypothetical protein